MRKSRVVTLGGSFFTLISLLSGCGTVKTPVVKPTDASKPILPRISTVRLLQDSPSAPMEFPKNSQVMTKIKRSLETWVAESTVMNVRLPSLKGNAVFHSYFGPNILYIGDSLDENLPRFTL